MIHNNVNIRGARVLVLGFTFKENCPDIRNSRVIDIVRELEDYGVKVDVCEPVAEAADITHEYGFSPVNQPKEGAYDAVLLAVKHKSFVDAGRDALARYAGDGELFDIKQVWG